MKLLSPSNVLNWCLYLSVLYKPNECLLLGLVELINATNMFLCIYFEPWLISKLLYCIVLPLLFCKGKLNDCQKMKWKNQIKLLSLVVNPLYLVFSHMSSCIYFPWGCRKWELYPRMSQSIRLRKSSSVNNRFTGKIKYQILIKSCQPNSPNFIQMNLSLDE